MPKNTGNKVQSSKSNENLIFIDIMGNGLWQRGFRKIIDTTFKLLVILKLYKKKIAHTRTQEKLNVPMEKS